MRKRKNKKRGPVRAKKVTFDGIKFASGLEKYMYQALKKAEIKNEYEGKTYVVQEELMDAVLYIQAARDELQDLSEESLIQKFNDDEYEEKISQE